MSKTANIIGATGLVGGSLVRLLLEDERYGTVRIFVRRSTGLVHDGLDEHVVDFENPGAWEGLLQGNELFSALGTTIKQAGTKDKQYRVDYTYQWNAASAAARNGVQRYLLVSSAGANAGSRMFYSRIKGQLDEAVSALPFSRIAIFRPSLLLGEREIPRPGERVGEVVLKIVDWVPGIRRYRGIPGATVAAAMVAVANQPTDERVTIHTLDELFPLAG